MQWSLAKAFRPGTGLHAAERAPSTPPPWHHAAPLTVPCPARLQSRTPAPWPWAVDGALGASSLLWQVSLGTPSRPLCEEHLVLPERLSPGWQCGLVVCALRREAWNPPTRPLTGSWPHPCCPCFWMRLLGGVFAQRLPLARGRHPQCKAFPRLELECLPCPCLLDSRAGAGLASA